MPGISRSMKPTSLPKDRMPEAEEAAPPIAAGEMVTAICADLPARFPFALF